MAKMTEQGGMAGSMEGLLPYAMNIEEGEAFHTSGKRPSMEHLRIPVDFSMDFLGSGQRKIMWQTTQLSR